MGIFSRFKENIPQLFRFGVVGSMGASINFFVYFIVSNLMQLGLNLSAVTAFAVAVSHNYVLNHLWTFSAENNIKSINFRQFTYYFLGNIQGLIINLAVLNLVVILAGINYNLSGQMLGVLLGMLSNYVFAKKIVFNKRLINKRLL